MKDIHFVPDSISWTGGNNIAHGTVALLIALLRHLDGNVTIFSDVRDEKNGMPYILDVLIEAEKKEKRFNMKERIRLIKAVKGMFE